MVHQAIERLIQGGAEPRCVAYCSVDNPVMHGMALEQLLDLLESASGHALRSSESWVFFDEIQYLRDWEVHLKTLVDDYPLLKCVVTGSSASALRKKANESGAGRFSDFRLPPLTFFEYIDLVHDGDHAVVYDAEKNEMKIERANEEFERYINYGGYPEIALNEAAQGDVAKYIKDDVIDRVIMRDLPSLYGIDNVQELNNLFARIAYNTGMEVTVEDLSQDAGIAKTTVRKYLEYLEAAFLVRRLPRTNLKARKYQRVSHFKVYLANTASYSALFGYVGQDQAADFGKLCETAVCSHWAHYGGDQHYARWDGKFAGEVDFVDRLKERSEFNAAVEVKWSDRVVDSPSKSMLHFLAETSVERMTCLTRSRSETKVIGPKTIKFVPAAEYCFKMGEHKAAISNYQRRSKPD